MTDKRSITSAENGKKGGRPVASATLRKQKMREMLSAELEAEWLPIVAKAIEQAKDGNQQARDWLSGYSLGKPAQAIVTEDEDGNQKPINGINYIVPDVGNNS